MGHFNFNLVLADPVWGFRAPDRPLPNDQELSSIDLVRTNLAAQRSGTYAESSCRLRSGLPSRTSPTAPSWDSVGYGHSRVFWWRIHKRKNSHLFDEEQ